MKEIIAEAKSDKGYPFVFFIEKAQVSQSSGEEMVIEGIASTTNVDHDDERMSRKALSSMANVINKEGVPLRIEHQDGKDAIIGNVFEGVVDERNQLKIKARLDPRHPISSMLFDALKKGVKLGLSVGGRVMRAVREKVESVGKEISTFYDVRLEEVSITPRPANYDAWLVRKGIVDSPENAFKFYNTGYYYDFLGENPQLDYIACFEKSIPLDDWRKVDNKINKEMSKDTKKEEVTDTTDDTKKAVDDSTTDETKKAEVTETDETKKAEEIDTTDDTKKAVDDSTTDETKKSLEDRVGSLEKGIGEILKLVKAMSDTETDETKKTAPTEGDGTDLTGERENKKSTKTEDRPTDETTDTAKTEDYKIDNETSEQKNKAQVEEFGKTIDSFIRDIGDKQQKSGKRFYGNQLRDFVMGLVDKDLELREFVSGGGESVKKSMSARAFVPGKDGALFKLVPADADEKIEKSNKKVDFKSQYISENSSDAVGF